MKLKFITLKNFRGIDLLEKLELSDLNTFVGKNDSGKSIILRALERFFDEKKFDEKDFYKGMNENDTTFIELVFQPPVPIDDLALDENGFIAIKKEFSSINGKIKNALYYLSNDFAQEEYQNLWNKKEQDLNQIISDLGHEPKKSGRGKKNILRIEQIKEILHDNERGNIYHSLDDYLKNLEKAYDFGLPEYSFFDAEQDLNIQATNFQSQFKPIITSYFENVKEETDNIETGLRDVLSKEFEEIRKYMRKNVDGLKQLNPSTDFDWSKSLKKFDLSLKFDGQDYDVPISHKGTGFKRLLMVAYFEYLADKKNVSNQIFAIEEPETFLHPQAQEDLLMSINRISKDSQFFLTTHSPVFAGATEGRNSILVTKNNSGASRYAKGGQDIIKKIINELGIKPDYNLLKNTKFIIFVEGPDDVIFIRTVANNMLGKNLTDDNIACLIGGGSTLANYADLNLFCGINNSKNYAVLVDGDNGDETKQKEKDRIRARCDSDGAIFCQMPKREIENYCCKDKIKECYIEEIKRKEGAESENPRIIEIESSDISFTDECDVEMKLREKGFNNFKNVMNTKIFESMTKEEWEEEDSDSTLTNFINEIYTRI